MTPRAITLDSTRLLGFDQAAKTEGATAVLAAKVGDKQSGIAAMAGSGLRHAIGPNLDSKVGIKIK